MPRLNIEQIVKIVGDPVAYDVLPFLRPMKDSALSALSKMRRGCRGCAAARKQAAFKAMANAFARLVWEESKKPGAPLDGLAVACGRMFGPSKDGWFVSVWLPPDGRQVDIRFGAPPAPAIEPPKPPV